MKSIRFKFFFWYVIILAVTFSLFSIILYSNLKASLYKKSDELLLSRAEGVAGSIDTYWETEKLEAEKSGITSAVFSKINNSNFKKIAQRWVKEKTNDPQLLNIMIQVYGPSGELIAFSQSPQAQISLSQQALGYALKGSNYFDNRQIGLKKDELLPIRILTIPVIENSRVAYIVQVASPLATVYGALSRLRIILFVLLPLTVCAASMAAGEFLTSITLKPISKMIHTARQITKSGNMELRIKLPESKDEIRQLADTFNDMLDKINKSFISQKQFIQDISHELRTPLTIVKGELEVTLKKKRFVDEYPSILRSNLEEINKISRIVDNLLMLARFDSEGVALKRESLDLLQLIKDILGDVEMLATHKGILINLLAKERLIMDGDKERLSRVFLNLFDNAIKYTPENGRLTLELEKKNNTAVIKISDSGIGIVDEDLPFIFDRFYRGDKSRSSAGFGLGLSIARSIVQAHHGRIEAESKPNQGATFIISLPLSSQAIP